MYDKITSKNEDDPHLASFRAAAICVTIALLIFSPVIYAGNRAYNVEITSEYVMSTGKCTCSHTDGSYKYQTRVFYNYDPSSRRYGVLNYEVGKCSQNVEGMWYSTVTDMDFCLVHGKSHDHRRYYLRPYNGVVHNYIVEDGWIVGRLSNYNSLEYAEKGHETVNSHIQRFELIKLFTAFLYSYKLQGKLGGRI